MMSARPPTDKTRIRLREKFTGREGSVDSTERSPVKVHWLL